MALIPTKIHGAIDYVVGLLLIAAPWLFGFAAGGAETWVPVALGAGVILYSLFTAYELGAFRLIPVPAHLWLDGIGGAFLLASPWLFGFADLVWWPHVVVGILEIGLAATTETTTRRARHEELPPRATGVQDAHPARVE